MKICDLHTHSLFSDGTLTPAELLDEAERIGLSSIALTDHNTVSGLPDFLAAAEGRKVEAVAGIEFSTDYNGTELHILGLFIGPRYFDDITALLAQAQRQKVESNKELIHNLNEAGFALNYEKLEAATPNGQFNRAHVAAELVRLGYAQSRQDAFERLLSPKRGYYHPPKRMTSFACIQYIRSIGAVSVLAHPFLNLSEEELRVFLEQAVACGLDAMETIYASYDEETTQTAKRMAEAFGLLQSGGSDFHGSNKMEIKLGVGKGNLMIPQNLEETLKQRRNAKNG